MPLIRPASTLVLCLLALLLSISPSPAYGPDQTHWAFSYPVNEDIKVVVVTLSYRWWDPNVDGDLASKKILLTTERIAIKPGQKEVPIEVLLNGAKSAVILGGQSFRGRGFVADDSFVRATVPRLNSNGFYVLAQKPGAGKGPVTMGDTENAAAWIELGIVPQP